MMSVGIETCDTAKNFVIYCLTYSIIKCVLNTFGTPLRIEVIKLSCFNADERRTTYFCCVSNSILNIKDRLLNSDLVCFVFSDICFRLLATVYFATLLNYLLSFMKLTWYLK